MKKDKDYYLKRATVGFKTLVIYFSVTRPQYEKAYKKDGKFSIDELLRQMKFLDEWKNRSVGEKKILFYKYKEYSKTFNYTFSIPVRLVQRIMGKYQGSRIHESEVIGKLIEDEWIVEVKHGSKITKDRETGDWKKVYSFSKKYLMKNKDYWMKLLSNPKYQDYTKYPMDEHGFVARAVKIISDWRKKAISDSTSKKTEAKNQIEFKQEEENKMENNTLTNAIPSNTPNTPMTAKELVVHAINGIIQDTYCELLLKEVFKVPVEKIDAIMKFVKEKKQNLRLPVNPPADVALVMWQRIRGVAGFPEELGKMVSGKIADFRARVDGSMKLKQKKVNNIH